MTSYWSRETESVVRLLIFDVRESGVLIWQIFYTEDLWVIDRSFTAKFWQRGHRPMKIHPRPPNRGSRLNLGGVSELAHLSDLHRAWMGEGSFSAKMATRSLFLW